MKIRGLLGLVPVLTAIAALAQVPHDRHVLFDNSLPDGSWFHSLGNVVEN